MDHQKPLAQQIWEATKGYVPKVYLPTVLRDNYFTNKSWPETLASDGASGFVIAGTAFEAR
jgi:hypothetical protein